MIFQFASDLHLEFVENRMFLQENPIEPGANILFLAGDIMPLNQIDDHSWFWDKISDQFENIYWIPGNHEYYGCDSGNLLAISTNISVRHNVQLVNNFTQIIDGVQCIFTTLWSEISPLNAEVIQKWHSDFHFINFEGKPLSVALFNEAHRISRKFLDSVLKIPIQNPSLVISHHVPTFLHYPSEYKGSPLNEAFAVDLFDYIEEKAPFCWIFGHHHCNTPVFKIGHTHLLTNQLGYVSKKENAHYSNIKIFKIND